MKKIVKKAVKRKKQQPKIVRYYFEDAPQSYSNGGNVKNEYNQLVGRVDDEYYFLNYIFHHSDGFKGATGDVIMPVSKSYYDYAMSREGIIERYIDSMGEDEWIDVIGIDREEYEDEDKLIEAIEDGIYDLFLAGQLHPFEEVDYDAESEMRKLPQFQDSDEFPIFEVVGGGRIFSDDIAFDDIYNQELYDKIKEVEGFKEGGELNKMVKIYYNSQIPFYKKDKNKYEIYENTPFIVVPKSQVNEVIHDHYVEGDWKNYLVPELMRTEDKTKYSNGGGIMADGRIILRTFNGVGGNKNKTYKLIKDDRDSDGKPYYTLIEEPSGNIMAQGDIFEEVNGYANLMSGKFSKGGGVEDFSEFDFEVGDKVEFSVPYFEGKFDYKGKIVELRGSYAVVEYYEPLNDLTLKTHLDLSRLSKNKMAKGGGVGKNKSKGGIGKSGTQYGYTLEEWEEMARNKGLLVSPKEWWKSQQGKSYTDSFGRKKKIGQHSQDERQSMQEYGYLIANGLDLGSQIIPLSAKKYVEENNYMKYATGGGVGKKYYWITMDRDYIDEYINYASRMNNRFEGEIYTQAPNKVAFDTENDMFAFTSMIENHNIDNDLEEGDEEYIHYEELFNGEPRENIFDKISSKNYAGGGIIKVGDNVVITDDSNENYYDYLDRNLIVTNIRKDRDGDYLYDLEDEDSGEELPFSFNENEIELFAKGGGVRQYANGGSVSKLKIGKDDFSSLLKLSDKELSKRLDLIREQQLINGKQYLEAKKKGENTSKIEEAGNRLQNQENAIIQARIKVYEEGGGEIYSLGNSENTGHFGDLYEDDFLRFEEEGKIINLYSDLSQDEKGGWHYYFISDDKYANEISKKLISKSGSTYAEGGEAGIKKYETSVIKNKLVGKKLKYTFGFNGADYKEDYVVELYLIKDVRYKINPETGGLWTYYLDIEPINKTSNFKYSIPLSKGEMSDLMKNRKTEIFHLSNGLIELDFDENDKYITYPYQVKNDGEIIYLQLSRSYENSPNGSKEYMFIDIDGNEFTGYGFTSKEAIKNIEEYLNKFAKMPTHKNKKFADGGEAGEDLQNYSDYDYYEVYDESTGKSLFIYAIDQEDAESIAEELDFESFEDGDEYNPNEDEYAGGGEVEDWMEEALDSLMEETGSTDLEISYVSDNGNSFYATDNKLEYRVFKTEEDAEETAIEQVSEDLEESPENFNQEWLSNFLEADNFFREILEEQNYGYATDIMTEDDDLYANRLIREMVDWGIMTEEEAMRSDAEQIASDNIQDFVNLLTDDQCTNGAFEYYANEFGKEEAYNLALQNNLIDFKEASENAVMLDGIGHFLSSFDGQTIYLSKNAVAYRTN